MDASAHFKGKKVTVMGIDPEGRGVQDALYAAQEGARVVVTDVKITEALGQALEMLKKAPDIAYHLGGHQEEDFTTADLVIRAASAPIGSPYLASARKAGVRVETDETLFLALAPAVATIGITGTRGKTTTTHLLYEIMKAATGDRAHVAGNVRGKAALPMLAQVEEGDTVVFELSSWQLQQFGENKLSPHTAVFTTFYPDHLNYYKGDLDAYLADKANIFLYQRPEDTFILGAQCADLVKEKYGDQIKSKIVIASESDLPSDWKLKVPGEHNRYDAALALAAARSRGVTDDVSRAAIESFAGVPGRLELVHEADGIKFYNDTTATTPEATIAALEALDPSNTKSVVAIVGGADKNLAMDALKGALAAHAKKVVFLAGDGTERLRSGEPVFNTLTEAVAAARSAAAPGDSILFSPAFASFGMFKNEYDRGDQFNALVRAV